ncbi:MerR family transcriptional regulator [Streptomyces sp. NPDC059637]|uniref:MerR family transcriptional regulator n=1 Tax=Streptomyces sp. NPDC059637 TaxID=3347752 RepID=UPI0036B67061
MIREREEGPDDPLMSIGVFARRARLSMKALRLYDRQGLLRPARVDPVSGYRRYRESQLATARTVVLLRRLDMPLAEVAKVLAAPGPAGAELVAAHWEAVERRVAAQRELAAHLRDRLSGEGGNPRMDEVREREVPEQVVLTEQRHVRVEELPGWIDAATKRLCGAAQAYGGPAGPVFVVYHGEVDEDGDGPVEICLPVAAGDDIEGDAAVRREPAHREAYVRLTKAQVEFPQILSAYDAVVQWAAARGRACTGAGREVYFADRDGAGPADEVCDVAFPVD